MKKWILSAMMLVTPILAMAEGVGVGNGGNGAREEYLARLKKEYGHVAVNSRSRINDIAAWCSRAGRILERELNRANRFIEKGRLEQASYTLIDALAAARDSMDTDLDRGAPMTRDLIERGLDYATALEQLSCQAGNMSCENGPQFLNAKLDFLTEYVRFVVRAERELDQPWYIPYRYGHYNTCRSKCYDDRTVAEASFDDYDSCWSECAPKFRFREFQKVYVDFARQQLEFFTKNFTEIVSRRGHDIVVPVGNPRVFLKLVELAAGYIAFDLRSNIFAYANSCSITELEQLVVDLSAFNLGDGSYWSTTPEAIADVRSRLDAVIAALGTCSMRY